jgi:hypothetical protein
MIAVYLDLVIVILSAANEKSGHNKYANAYFRKNKTYENAT